MKARFGASFWDGVEREVEALDLADFGLFLGADRLALEPRPGFEDALSAHLSGLFRTRWSN
ncbi:MAG TPA: hypothetical protein VMR86_20100 [Myxococcota bacterium]|nr:hypothetical protein [Myxococcota bacterium]